MRYQATIHHATPDGILHQQVEVDADSEPSAILVINSAYPGWGVEIKSPLIAVYMPMDAVKFLANITMSVAEFNTLKEACEKACQQNQI